MHLVIHSSEMIFVLVLHLSIEIPRKVKLILTTTIINCPMIQLPWSCLSYIYRYNLLFKFLLALRRAQMALQQSWAHLMQFRNRAGELRAIWELRTHMGFLVDNLQYYVQVRSLVGVSERWFFECQTVCHFDCQRDHSYYKPMNLISQGPHFI